MLAQVAVNMYTLGLSKLRWAELTGSELVAFVAIVLAFFYIEGYRAFHKAFSPMLVRRTMAIEKGSPWYVHVFGPFFVGGFFDGTPRRLAVSWGLVFGIAALGVAVANAGYPWREFIDVGVGVGLSIGILSTAYFTYLAAAGTLPDIDGQFARRSRPAALLAADSHA
jgi:hypothetical protein